MAISHIIAGLVRNADHALHRSQMAPEWDAPTIRLRANNASNTLTIMDSGIGMNEQGLNDIVTKGQQNTGRGNGVTFYTASLVVPKVAVRTKDSNGCQYKCESMEDGSFHIIKDDNAEQLHRGTKITLFLSKDQLEYLEEEVIKDLVEKECGSVCYPIYLKVEKEPEQNEGEIQEVPEWQVIHKPKALGPSNNPLVANVNMVAEAGAKNPNVILSTVAKAHLRGKVDNAIIAEPGSFVADMPYCRIKDGILEMNPNNEKVKKLKKMVERGESEAVELAVELIYDNAIILNKPKKPVTPLWKRMINRLRSCCVIVQGTLAIGGVLESAFDGDAAPDSALDGAEDAADA